MKKYRLTLKHDSGKHRIVTWATDEKTAREIVCKSERCPNNAILKVEHLKLYVTMTDKFMSGWGRARGLINKLVIECDTLEQAETIERNAQKRDEMKSIRIVDRYPNFSTKRYITSDKVYSEMGEIWTK